MTDIFEKLAAPFPPAAISWRVGSVKKDGTAAMALAYIDARDVMDRFDEACGPGGWQCRYPHANGKTVCDIAVKVGDEWVWKADGAGDSDIEAEKGALSDAFKRAAVRWGVGRYLYHLPSPWVRIDQYKKIIPEEEGRLRKLLEGRGSPKVTAPGVVSGTDLAEELASNLLKGCGSKELLKDAWDKNEEGWKKVLDEPSFLRVKGLCIHLAKQFADAANQREAA